MFDYRDADVGLWPGERTEISEGLLAAEDQVAYEETCLVLADEWVDPDRHVLPDDLESIPPGVFLTAILGSLDPEKLNGHDAVRLMQSRARLSSHHEAGKYVAMAEIAYAPPCDPESGVLRSSEEVEYAAVEVAAALRLTRRASEDQLSRAVSLTGRLRRVLHMFAEGRFDLPRVQVFEQQVGHLPRETVDTVLDRILDDAPELTTGQLRARLARLVMEADPDGSKSSFEEGLNDRKVSVYANPDHTANFGIYSADPERVAAARAHVEKLARHLKTEGESRGLDELRADVALDLLAGHCLRRNTNSGGGKTNVTIPAETLLELSDKPGELDGYGPVIAEIARKTAVENVDGKWTFTVTDQGRPVATGTLSRRPSASQKRQVRADYPTCVFPGCRHPATDCDLDHRHPYSEGGATDNENLGPVHRYHHIVRHNTRWRYVRLHNGDHQWTSPLGHTYIRKRDPPH